MKTMWLALALVLVIGSGCVMTSGRKKNPAKDNLPIGPPPPVTPAMVRPDNAHQVAQDLWDEMEREEKGDEKIPEEPKVQAGKRK